MRRKQDRRLKRAREQSADASVAELLNQRARPNDIRERVKTSLAIQLLRPELSRQLEMANLIRSRAEQEGINEVSGEEAFRALEQVGEDLTELRMLLRWVG